MCASSAALLVRQFSHKGLSLSNSFNSLYYSIILLLDYSSPISGGSTTIVMLALSSIFHCIFT